MDVRALKYPVIAFNDQVFYIYSTSSDLTVCNRGAVKHGWFKGMLLVDGTGLAYRVRDAVPIRKARFSWHSLVFDPLVEVMLEQDGVPYAISVHEVRDLMYTSSIRWDGLESRGDFEELRAKIAHAQTVAELIQVLPE
jgi:hypothetical protein